MGEVKLPKKDKSRENGEERDHKIIKRGESLTVNKITFARTGMVHFFYTNPF